MFSDQCWLGLDHFYSTISGFVIKNNLKLSFFITGNTTGLLGYWDDSQESEFLRPDGTYLSTNSSLEVIHRDFGQLCTQSI